MITTTTNRRFELRQTVAALKNPLFHERSTAGLKSLRWFKPNTKFVIRHNFRTNEIVSVGILWGEYVHTVLASDPKAAALCELLTSHSIGAVPGGVTEAMMAVDPYFGGGDTSPSSQILDILLAEGAITAERMIDLLDSILIEEKG